MPGSCKELDKCRRVARGPNVYLTDFEDGDWYALDCCDFPEVAESYYNEAEYKGEVSKSVQSVVQERGWRITKRSKYGSAEKEVYELDTKSVTCPFAKRIHNYAWQRLEV